MRGMHSTRDRQELEGAAYARIEEMLIHNLPRIRERLEAMAASRNPRRAREARERLAELDERYSPQHDHSSAP